MNINFTLRYEVKKNNTIQLTKVVANVLAGNSEYQRCIEKTFCDGSKGFYDAVDFQWSLSNSLDLMAENIPLPYTCQDGSKGNLYKLLWNKNIFVDDVVFVSLVNEAIIYMDDYMNELKKFSAPLIRYGSYNHLRNVLNEMSHVLCNLGKPCASSIMFV